MRKILVVAAHPDDEVLGCGGTIARLSNEGSAVFVLILGEGITSRDNQRDIQKRKEELLKLKKQAEEANNILGVQKVFFCNFPDNRFDTVSLLDIIKSVEKVKNEIKPNTIFTHYEKDLNIDHQITYKAVITASRPLKDERVETIYSFEIPSSTEWGYPLSFSPNVFFDISGTMKVKLKAMEQYKSELKEFLHPRSLKGMKLNANYWGIKINKEFVESFQLVRDIQV